MIAGMMDELEQKLGKDDRDLEGWKRLIRARRISNEIDKAKISLDLALNVFKDEPATLDALRALAKEWGSIDVLLRLMSVIPADAGIQAFRLCAGCKSGPRLSSG